RQFTATPLPKSRYCSPVVAISQEPSPRSNTTFWRAYVPITAGDGPVDVVEVAVGLVAGAGCDMAGSSCGGKAKKPPSRGGRMTFMHTTRDEWLSTGAMHTELAPSKSNAGSATQTYSELHLPC